MVSAEYLTLTCPVLHFPFLSCLILYFASLYCPFLTCTFVSFLVLFCPVLTCTVLFFPVLSFPSHFCLFLFFSFLSFPFFSCPVLSFPVCLLQMKYKEAGKKELSTNLYSLLPETEQMKFAKAAMELQSEVGGLFTRHDHTLGFIFSATCLSGWVECYL